MLYSMKPLSCDPTKIKGMSERLIVSHYENNYRGGGKKKQVLLRPHPGGGNRNKITSWGAGELLSRSRSPASLPEGPDFVQGEAAIFVRVHCLEDPLVSRLKLLQSDVPVTITVQKSRRAVIACTSLQVQTNNPRNCFTGATVRDSVSLIRVSTPSRLRSIFVVPEA
jgi:hypothetical protein